MRRHWMIEDNRYLYKAREEVFGQRYQLRQAQEEAGELIAAINHYIKERPGSLAELIDETADVLLMIEQIMSMIGEDAIIDRAKEKVVIIKRKTREAIAVLNEIKGSPKITIPYIDLGEAIFGDKGRR